MSIKSHLHWRYWYFNKNIVWCNFSNFRTSNIKSEFTWTKSGIFAPLVVTGILIVSKFKALWQLKQRFDHQQENVAQKFYTYWQQNITKKSEEQKTDVTIFFWHLTIPKFLWKRSPFPGIFIYKLWSRRPQAKKGEKRKVAVWILPITEVELSSTTNRITTFSAYPPTSNSS